MNSLLSPLHRRATLLGLCTLQLAFVAPAQNEAAAAKEDDNPLQAMARVVGDHQWRVGEGGMYNVYHRFDWGPEERTLLSTTYRIGDDGIDWPFQQGVLFWDPAQKRIRGIRWEEQKLYVDSLEIRENTWDLQYQQFSAKSSSGMVDRWVWNEAGDGFEWTNLLEGGFEWLKLDFVKEARGSSGLPVTPDAELPAGNLKPLAAFAGKSWIVDGKLANGRPLKNRIEYEWGVGKVALVAHTYAIEDGGEKHTVDTYYYWHSGEKAIRMTSIATWGLVTEGTVRQDEEGKLVVEATILGDREAQTIEHMALAEDGKSYSSQIWAKVGEQQQELLSVTFQVKE